MPAQLSTESRSPKTPRRTRRPKRRSVCRSAPLAPRRRVSVRGNSIARSAGAERRQHQKQIGAAGDVGRILKLPCRGDDQCQHADDDDGANQSRQIGIDVLDADLGENRGQRRKDRRQNGPQLQECAQPETAPAFITRSPSMPLSQRELTANTSASTSTAGVASANFPAMSLHNA